MRCLAFAYLGENELRPSNLAGALRFAMHILIPISISPCFAPEAIETRPTGKRN
jgi:hypothetical protein